MLVVVFLTSTLPFPPALFDVPGAYAGIVVVFVISTLLASVVNVVELSAIGGYLG